MVQVVIIEKLQVEMQRDPNNGKLSNLKGHRMLLEATSQCRLHP